MAQLFRLNITSEGNKTSLTLKIGKALGATTEAIAIAILLIGAAYFMKQQQGLMKGVILSRGWDVLFMSVASFVVSTNKNMSRAKEEALLTGFCSYSLSYLVCSRQRINGSICHFIAICRQGSIDRCFVRRRWERVANTATMQYDSMPDFAP